MAARLVTSSRVILARILKAREPTGRTYCYPTRVRVTNSTLRRETCEDRHARLPCGDAVPEVWSASSTVGPLRGRSLPGSAQNYDQSRYDWR